MLQFRNSMKQAALDAGPVCRGTVETPVDDSTIQAHAAVGKRGAALAAGVPGAACFIE